MNHRTSSRLVSTLVLCLALALASLALSSCASPAVGSVAASPDIGGAERPTALSRWDGDVFVGWANTNVVVEVFTKGGGPLYGPLVIPAGKGIAYRKSTSEKWTGDWPAPLPGWASVLFKPEEIAAWQLEFEFN